MHWNNAVGYALGMWQGYSVGWWRARHNTHHLVTNEDGNDPDIKTAPLLVYVRNNPAIAATLNAVQRWQQYYYVPLMSILDAYWRFESLQVPRTPSPAAKRTPTLAPSLPLAYPSPRPPHPVPGGTADLEDVGRVAHDGRALRGAPLARTPTRTRTLTLALTLTLTLTRCSSGSSAARRSGCSS